jgi:hypothetical protein
VTNLVQILEKSDKYLKIIESISNPWEEWFEEWSEEALLEEYLNWLSVINTEKKLDKVLQLIINNKDNLLNEVDKEKAKLTQRKEVLAKWNFDISSFDEKDWEIIVHISGIDWLYEYKIDWEFEWKEITHVNAKTWEEFTYIANKDENWYYTVKLNTWINDWVSDSDTVTKLDTNKYRVWYIDKTNYLKAQKESIKKYIQKQNEK